MSAARELDDEHHDRVFKALADPTRRRLLDLLFVEDGRTLGDLERSRGQLVVVSGRINGKVSVSVEAYQLDAENSKQRVRDEVVATLKEFGLTATID